jgi:hypothetical protein
MTTLLTIPRELVLCLYEEFPKGHEGPVFSSHCTISPEGLVEVLAGWCHSEREQCIQLARVEWKGGRDT